MDAVYAGAVVIGDCVRLDEVHVFVLLAGYPHHAVRNGNLRSLGFFYRGAEGASFPVDRLLEYERFSGMRRLYLLDEREEAFADHLGRRI